ncbi:hypothetical protein FGO68_gene13105 [Halteria grandinella]|uniref:MORN repeat protein n=1 Tax=Halteria grandinella TaxID=5974 RepID=A0A8J8NSP3_HALGN|nr:hypothetical protein FGO68_gene13105 [Halteria grandinella]
MEKDLNKFLQIIRQEGHNKLAEAAIQHGLSIDRLNKLIHQNRQIKHLVFEGLIGDGITRNRSIYWGQCVGEVRDGWGLVYCTDSDNDPHLYECEWDKGTPVKGREIWIVDNEWRKYEGAFDHEYLQTGTGNVQSEDGSMFEGEWKRGMVHGRGKGVRANGESYEGEFQNGRSHGQGRWTYPDGRYEEGQYEDGKKIGVHMHFSKDGWLIALLTYKDGQLVNVENIE